MSNKPKCPVFGCTIPRGIPHEHPAGVSVVMRDPTGPLDAFERAELERYRAEDEQDRRTVFLRHNKDSQPRISLADMHARYAEPGSLQAEAMRRNSVYVVPADAKIHGGRKLTQALLDAGRIRRETADLGVVFNEAPAPRRSFVSLTARVAFWIVLAVTVGIWIFAGVKS